MNGWVQLFSGKKPPKGGFCLSILFPVTKHIKLMPRTDHFKGKAGIKKNLL